MKNNITETIITIALIAVAILLLNPFGFWMPDMMVMAMLASILVLFAIFAGFIVREKHQDERDIAHRALAGRNAYLAGTAILIIAIAFEGHVHKVDPWLVIALVGMIVAKILTRFWSDKNL